MNENIKSKYKAVDFVPSNTGDIACNHCVFELGKCRGAIWTLGQCYVVNEKGIEKNIYYEEIQEQVFA